MIKFDRAGAKRLLKTYSKVRLCKLLNLSRPWLDELLDSRDIYNQDRAALTNARIKNLLAKL